MPNGSHERVRFTVKVLLVGCRLWTDERKLCRRRRNKNRERPGSGPGPHPTPEVTKQQPFHLGLGCEQ